MVPRIYATISCYIARRFLLALIGVLLIILGLITLLEMIELLRRSGPSGAHALTLLTLALLKLPKMTQEVLPFAVLIGGIIAMWRLSRSHELVILRAAGVSVWRFLAPALVLVGVIGAANITLVNPLTAMLYKSYLHKEDSLILNRESNFDLSEKGLWLREPHDDGSTTIVHAASVRRKGPDLALRDLLFIFVDDKERFQKRIDAARARWTNTRFELQDVWVMEPGQPGRRLGAMTLPTALTPGRVQENFAKPETVSFWELPKFIAFLEASGFSANRYRIYLHRLIASPVLLCAMAIVGVIFSIGPNQKAGGGLRRVLGAMACGFLLYFFSRLTLALGSSSTLPPWLSAWTPTLVALMLGVATLLHREDG